MAVYVDDIVLGGRNKAEMNTVKKKLGHRFEMKDLGKLHHFLGITVIQDQLGGLANLSIQKILQRYEMHECKPVGTPVNPNTKLVANDGPDVVINQ